MGDTFTKVGFLTPQQCYDLLMAGASKEEIAAVARENARQDPLRNLVGRPPHPDDPDFDSNALRQ